MPSLNELLEHTMVFVAARGAGKEPAKAKTALIFAKPALPSKETEYSDDEAEKLSIWHFEVDADPSKIKKVTCLARGMKNARMGVCDEISFGSVKVQLPGGAPVELKLEKKFLFASYGIDGGKILGQPKAEGPVTGAKDLYPLEMNVDKAFVHAFVFEFPDGATAAPKPTEEKRTQSPYFMPNPAPPGSIARTSLGGQTAVSIDLFRVVVFASLVTCKERADFDPGGVLGGGRLIPHLMIMGNRALKSVDASVTLARPAMHSMEGGECPDDMNPGIESSLFADDNDAEMITASFNQVPSPFWDDLFSAFESPAPLGTYHVVRPDTGLRDVREVKDAMLELNDNDLAHGLIPLADEYELGTIERVPRQGAYDNIHTAPTMKVREKWLGVPIAPGVPRSILDKVYMAPFCEHDCLHTHWRWGAFTDERQNLGWALPNGGVGLVYGRPNAEVGVPMVPGNQKVELKVNSSSSYTYSVHVEGTTLISAGSYSFINHHGSGYAVSIASGTKMLTAKTFVYSAVSGDTQERLLPPGTLDGPSFYWHLRYALFLKGTYVAKPRLKIKSLAGVHDG